MNMAATHSNSAVPSMLTVAPSGRTKLVVRFETPAFFSTHSMVRGKVEAEEDVEKAVNNAGAIARKGEDYQVEVNVLEMDDKTSAQILLKQLIKQFPGSNEAKIAESKLKAID